jgi:peptidoglycan/LPS O-acetylase OafA/YrhL
MTTSFLLVLLGGRSTINGDIGGPAYILASYLFIPWPRPDGVLQPAFGLGWTLNYEMFFYAVFTPFLLLPRKPAVIAATILLAGFATTGAVIAFPNLQLAFWSNPIILEFCAGMLLAILLPGVPGLSLPARLALAAAALAGLHFAVTGAPQWRAAIYGIPALLLVAAATLGAPAAQSGGKILVRLGDASYAMYLVHPFIMRAFTVLWHKFHADNELAGTIYVLAGLTVAQACALAVNLTVERKFALLLRGGRGLKNEAV